MDLPGAAPPASPLLTQHPWWNHQPPQRRHAICHQQSYCRLAPRWSINTLHVICLYCAHCIVLLRSIFPAGKASRGDIGTTMFLCPESYLLDCNNLLQPNLVCWCISMLKKLVSKADYIFELIQLKYDYCIIWTNDSFGNQTLLDDKS